MNVNAALQKQWKYLTEMLQNIRRLLNANFGGKMAQFIMI